MKHLVFAAAFAAASYAAPALAQVGVSVSLGEPNFFGRIEIGGAPPPQLVFHRPVIVDGGPLEGRDPVYLHVRPGYERDWRRHCAEYNACGQPVFFVRDDWYRDRYVPHYREHRGEYEHEDRGNHYGRDERRDEGRDDRRDERRDEHRDERRDDRRDEHRDEHRDGHRDEHRDDDRH